MLSVWASLAADFIGVIAAIIIGYIFFRQYEFLVYFFSRKKKYQKVQVRMRIQHMRALALI